MIKQFASQAQAKNLSHRVVLNVIIQAYGHSNPSLLLICRRATVLRPLGTVIVVDHVAEFVLSIEDDGYGPTDNTTTEALTITEM